MLPPHYVFARVDFVAAAPASLVLRSFESLATRNTYMLRLATNAQPHLSPIYSENGLLLAWKLGGYYS